MLIQITIPGAPKVKGRPRFARIGGFIRAYTPKETHEAEAFIAKCYKEQAPKKRPEYDWLEIECIFHIPIPENNSQKKKQDMEGAPCVKRPDIDNYLKLILDGLNGVAWEDDNAIASIKAEKKYSAYQRTDVNIYYYKKDLTNKEK